MTQQSLSLENLAIGYGAATVAAGISATIEPGRMACLLGRNGSGKSTLFKTIARLLPPLAGRILIGGRDAGAMERRELARLVGIVLTERPETYDMTARDVVSTGRAPYTGFFGRLSPGDRRTVDEALAKTGVKDLAARRLSTLSDGERQKVLIAKALAQETPVILLDEPTAFLDFPSKVELMQLLRRLAHDERKTVLLSTHDLQLALRSADMLWLMEENGAGAEAKSALSIHRPPLGDDVLNRFLGPAAAEFLKTPNRSTDSKKHIGEK